MSRTSQEIAAEETQFLNDLADMGATGTALAVAKRYTSLHISFERIGAQSDALPLETVDQAIERCRGALDALSKLRGQIA
ncbi:MAG: hypothetical protein Q8Q82_13815 [Hydrogenophaga sp.]|nr:hypothetical protein [Hydrogenophaga sp.]